MVVHKKRNLFENRFRHLILILLLTLSLLLILGKKIDKGFLDSIREALWHPTIIVVEALTSPWRGLVSLAEKFGEWKDLHVLYQEAQTELKHMQELEIYTSQLELENLHLRQLLYYPGNFLSSASNMIAAKVIADNSGFFTHSLLVDLGDEQGVNDEHIALSRGKLIGRIVYVDRNVARILLVNDFNSRIPVLIGPEGIRGLLAGNNTDRPRLIFLPNDTQLQQDMAVITSGHGGIFPAGIPIGYIDKVNGEEVLVKLSSEDDALNFVFLLYHQHQKVTSQP